MQDRLSKVQANVAKQLLLHDLVLTIEHDFETYNAFIENAPAWNDKGLAPTDPVYNTLGPSNSYWLAVRDRDHRVVGCVAQRIWQQSRFCSLVNEGRFLYDGTKEMGKDTFHLFAEGLGHIQGNIAYLGGGWIAPAYRGISLLSYLILMANAKALQDHDVDYVFSIVRPTMVEKGIALKSYFYYHMDYGATMWRSHKAERVDVWILHNSRADILREMSYWLTNPD